MKPRARIAALASLVLTPLTVLAVNQPNASAVGSPTGSFWCADPSPAPCIVSATIDGNPIPHDGIIVDGYSDDFEAQHNTGFTVLDLGPEDEGAVIQVVMKTHIKPRVTSMTGGYVNVLRSHLIDDWYVDVTMNAVEMLESDCSGPDSEPCVETASPDDVQVQAQGNINDAYWLGGEDEAQWDAMMGLDQFSNINLLWYPPTIATSSTGAVQLVFEMANSHYYPGGAVFHGFANVRIPNNVLRDFYGIPNPETMVPGSLVGTIGTGSVEAYEVESANAWQIDATGITFSKRKLKTTRGVIVPRKPQGLFGARTGATTAKLTFAPAGERGAKVTGYQARCVSAGGHVVTKLRADPIESVTVGGLRVGVKYTCKVRAKSKVGYGPFSTGVTVPRKP